MSYLKDYWIKSTSAINMCSPSGQWWHVKAYSAIEAVTKWSESPFNFHDDSFIVEKYVKYNEKRVYGPDQGGEQGRILAIKFLEAADLETLNLLALERRIACIDYPASEAEYDSIHRWEWATDKKFPWKKCKLFT